MNLANFPAAIADAERILLKATQALRTAQAELDQLNAMIDSTIAHDTDLKNDAQRKAKKAELVQDPLYQECLNEYHHKYDERTACEIEVTLLRNQFTALKLLTREAIALRELQLTDAA